MTYKLFFIYIISTVMIFSCAVNKVAPDVTSTSRDAVKSEKLVDESASGSVNNDAFIRNIDKNDDKDLTIHVVPPEKPKEVILVYDTLQAFAVQLKAFGEEEPARALVNQLRQVEPDSVFYYADGYLFKVRIGPYFTRSEAEKKRDNYRQGSFAGAWVSPHLVIRSHEVDKVNEEKKDINIDTPKSEAQNSGDSGIFIQIASATSRANAEQFLIRNKKVSGYTPKIFSIGDRYKIAIGPFLSRDDAEKALPDVRSQFPGAWLITR